MTIRPHPDWAREAATWPNSRHSRFLRVGNVGWHIQEMGTGPDLLLLHGAGATTHSWRDLMPALARGRRVTAIDLPGHGFTRAPHGPIMGLPGMAGAVAALAEALGLDLDAVIGHSAGTAVAIEMALQGTACRRIVGLNAALTPFRGIAGVLFPPMAKALALNPVTPWVFSRFAGWTGQARRLIEGTGSNIGPRGNALYARAIARPGHVAGALEMMSRWELEPMLARLGEIDIPITLIVGERDRAVPPGEARRLARKVAGIELISAGQLGHLMHEERPDEVAVLIRDILGGAPTEARDAPAPPPARDQPD